MPAVRDIESTRRNPVQYHHIVFANLPVAFRTECVPSHAS
jgi:hypothetical protein